MMYSEQEFYWKYNRALTLAWSWFIVSLWDRIHYPLFLPSQLLICFCASNLEQGRYQERGHSCVWPKSHSVKLTSDQTERPGQLGSCALHLFKECYTLRSWAWGRPWSGKWIPRDSRNNRWAEKLKSSINTDQHWELALLQCIIPHTICHFLYNHKLPFSLLSVIHMRNVIHCLAIFADILNFWLLFLVD